MLENLTIKNYVIVGELNLNFSDGFSVLTGETGAGKSTRKHFGFMYLCFSSPPVIYCIISNRFIIIII